MCPDYGPARSAHVTLPPSNETGMTRRTAYLLAAAVLVATAGCGRQQEGTERQDQPPGEAAWPVGQVWIDPGPDTTRPLRVENPYAGDLDALQDGARLYAWYNCSTCHGPYGGGGIGPALRDTNWIYGGDPVSIFASIVEGRPDGMPTWRGSIPEDDVWKLVAFVRSLSEPGGSPVVRLPQPTEPGS